MSTITLQVLRLAVLAVFAILTARSYRRWRHGGGGVAAGWLSASFVVLTSVTLAGIVFAGRAGEGQGHWPWKLTAALLLLFPYCLSAFTASFRSTPGRLLAVCRAVTVVVVVWTLAMPAPPPGGRPPFFGAYAFVVLGEWTAFSVLAAGWLWASARGEAPVARRRMRTISAGSLFVNIAILTRVLALPSAPRGTQVAVQVFGLAGAWLFFLGFTPPRPLRALWRQGELAGFHRAQADLLAAFDPEAVSRVIVAQAVQLLGAKAAFMTAADGRVLAAEGIAPADAATLATGAPDVVRVPVRGGWLAVQASRATPFFGIDENDLLQALCDSAVLGLERTELFVRDHASRMALQQRESQLAQAHHLQAALAQLGQRALQGPELAVLFEDARAVVVDVLGVERAEIIGAPGPEGLPGSVAEVVIAGHAGADSVLRVHGPAAEAFGPTELDFLRSIANILAAAIQRHETEAALAHQALHDSLTGLPNRALLLDRLSQAAARSGRQPAPLAVLFLDLDRFKVVNDGLGHRAGDELLQAVANRLLAVVRPNDTVARLGGDEFVVVCENLLSENHAILLADRIAEVLATPVTVSGRDVTISASIGVVVTDAGHIGAEELLRDADVAMYRAKEKGRARFAVRSVAPAT